MDLTWLRAAVLSVCLALLATFSVAQVEGPDYERWQNTATRAEQAVEAARASDQAFEVLRAEVANWRQQFQNQLNANDSRLQTLRDQIAALGPAPDEGLDEATEIADRRAELNAQLERLSTPRRTAEEAFSRANGVITEIDDILRQRQTDALLNMGPWPVNPAYWADALRHVQDTVNAMIVGAQQAWRNPSNRANAQDNLPLIVVFLIVGVVLLARSRYWSELLAVRIQRSDTRSGARVAGFVVSLGQILFPMLGLIAFVRAIRATQLFGPRGDLLLDTLEVVGLVLFFARWLASRLFPKDEALRTSLAVPARRRSEGRIYAVTLGIVLALYILLAQFSEFDRYDPGSDAVLNFPLIVLACLMLIRLGWLLAAARARHRRKRRSRNPIRGSDYQQRGPHRHPCWNCGPHSGRSGLRGSRQVPDLPYDPHSCPDRDRCFAARCHSRRLCHIATR